MKLRDLIPAWGRKATTVDIIDALDVYERMITGRRSKSGKVVTWETALKVSTVLACAGVIARGIAQVPLKVMQDEAGNKRAAREHPLYWLLHNQPNEWQTSYEYRETMALHLVLCGRHIAVKNVFRGEILELLPVEPQRVRIQRERDGRLRYFVTVGEGMSQEYEQDQVWHVRGLGWNGWDGLEPLVLARDAIGLSIATEDSQSALHKNGLRTSGTYSVDAVLSKHQYDDLRQHLIKNYAGESAGLPMIVDRAAKWLSSTMTGVDAQHLETRRFQVEEVCRALGVMPIMVGHADKSQTYASSEQQFIAHVVHTLSPWYQRIEQSIDAHLLGKRQVQQGYYAKFVPAGLLRGAIKDQGDYFAKALGAGGSPPWMTQDEVRDLLEMNPMGGDAAKLPVATNLPPAPPAGGN
mgnify:FL=1